MRDDAIAEDVPCRACGYNVRGLSGGGRCPECSEGIAGSVAEFETRRAKAPLPLESAEPAWVGRVARGCMLMLAGGVLNLFVVGVSLVSFAAILRPARLTFLATLVPIPWPYRMVGHYVATVLIAAGVWLVVSPEAGAARGKTWRWTVRACLCVLCPLRWTWILMNVSGDYTSRILLQCDWILVSVVTWGGLRVLSELARRGNCRRLGRAATALAWVIPMGIVAQGVWLRWFEVTTGVTWTAYADPMFGALPAAALIPFSYWFWPRVDANLVAWTPLAGLALASAAVQVGVWRRLYSAKKRKRVENL